MNGANVIRDSTLGVDIPAEMTANLLYRKEILAQATQPGEARHRRNLIELCRESLTFWMATFVWTYRQKEPDEEGRERPAAISRVPFIPFPYQVPALQHIQKRIRDGGDLCIDKSRDMGASWLILLAFHHEWLFFPDRNFLELSRKEPLVDDKGNPDCLFWKHDFINDNLPKWMLSDGDYSRKHMLLVHKKNNSTIAGESTNSYAGQGGRRTAIMLDEFARMDNGMSILTATADTSPSRIFNSTPNGRGTAHFKVRFSGKTDVLVLHWADHPEKGRGRHKVPDAVHGGTRWTSPWYEAECARRPSPREIAENLDIDHIGSGRDFFDSVIINRHTQAHCRDPLMRGDFIFDASESEDWRIRERQRDLIRWEDNRGRRRWKLWIEPDERTGLAPGEDTYVMGVDISYGEGASNSAICVYARSTGEKVGEFACPNTPPEQLAREVALAGLWFGGVRGCAFVVPEANGPGAVFIRQLVGRYEYPWVYVQRSIEKKGEPRTKKYGWHSSRDSKEVLLGEYRIALARDDIKNRSFDAMGEVGSYTFYDSGEIGPSELAEDTSGARKAHGDRVIADALAVMGLRQSSRSALPTPALPEHSFEARRRAQRHRRKTADRRW